MKQPESHRILVRPWADGWQVWGAPEGADAWQLRSSGPAREDFPNSTDYLCLPAQKTACLCFWVASADEATVRQSAALQAELNGLVGKGQQDGAVETDLIRREHGRTLVRVLAFPRNFSLPAPCDVHLFIPSPLALNFGHDGIFLWQENGALVAALVADGQALCWETCPNTSPASEIRGWLELFLLELQDADVLGQPKQIRDCTGILGEEPVAGISVEPAPSPEGFLPSLPGRTFAWLPTEVRVARESALRRKHWVRAASVAAALLAAAVLAATGYTFYLRWDTARIHAQLRPAEKAAEPVIRAARQWELLSPSIDTREFVLEKLLLAVSALPPDGVRLSVFESTPQAIRIEGDARNVGLATMYFNSLQSSSEGQLYDWNMPPPALQPDNSARFAIDAVFRP